MFLKFKQNFNVKKSWKKISDLKWSFPVFYTRKNSDLIPWFEKTLVPSIFWNPIPQKLRVIGKKPVFIFTPFRSTINLNMNEFQTLKFFHCPWNVCCVNIKSALVHKSIREMWEIAWLRLRITTIKLKSRMKSFYGSDNFIRWCGHTRKKLNFVFQRAT